MNNERTHVFSFGDESELFFRKNFRRGSLLVLALVFVHFDLVARRKVIRALDGTFLDLDLDLILTSAHLDLVGRRQVVRALDGTGRDLDLDLDLDVYEL